MEGSNLGAAGNIPMGMLTPTNSPRCKAGPVDGTKFPSRIPIAMARMIHNTRNLSSRPSPLNGGISFGSLSSGMVGETSEPFSRSVWGWIAPSRSYADIDSAYLWSALRVFEFLEARFEVRKVAMDVRPGD